MGCPVAAPASWAQRQARARGRRTCHPGCLAPAPGEPRTYCQSPWSRREVAGRPPRGWGTHAAPGRARSRQAPARSRAATRTDAPAARPRRAAPRPAVAASWVAPAGVPTPQPSQVSPPPPSLPCPAQPAAASFPKTKQLATWPAPLQVSRLLYSPAEQTLGTLPCFFQFTQAWYFFPAMSTLSPAEMSKVGSRWGRERGKGHTCAPGAPLILLFCLLGENRALCVAGYQISIK